MVVIKFLVNKH